MDSPVTRSLAHHPASANLVDMRRTLWILAAVGLVAVLAIGVSQAGEDEPAQAPVAASTLDLSTLEGAPAPLAALHDDANVIRSADVDSYERTLRELRGYPVVVNAWASWCGPCKLEFPMFQKAGLRLGSRVAFLGLNVSDNRQEAEAFLKKVPVPYPHLEDSDARIVQKAGAAGGLPATIYYDAKGERAFIHQGGYRTERDLIDDIRRYTGA